MNYYERIQKSINYIESNLENDISLEQAAQEAFMSTSNFYRMFLAIAGHSAKEYIRLRRISFAAEDIRYGNLRVIDIAVKYAYNSADSFSRAFKNVTGFLPTEFRNQKQSFSFERMNIMDKYFELQDQELLEQYPDIKVLKELEPMRVAYYCYFGKNPEDHAFEFLSKWIKKNGINLKEPNYRIFGYNNPSPSTPDQEEYGYEVCITLDDNMVVNDENVKEKKLSGGLYAVTSVKRSDNIGEDIMKAWQRFNSWLRGSKYRYGGHQWLEEHLGFNEDADHIGGVDIYMPIAEGESSTVMKTFQQVEPMYVATYTATGKNATEEARAYFFQWAEGEKLFSGTEKHRVFAYYNHERMGQKDFFYKIHVTVGEDFSTDDNKIQLETFSGGYYAVMNSKLKYNGWAWGDFINWISLNKEYTVGDYWFFEEYLIDAPQLEEETDMLLYMPVKSK